MAEYFVMQMLYYSSSLVRPISDICAVIKQACLWNAEYAIMYGLIMHQSSIKSDNMSLKKVVDH